MITKELEGRILRLHFNEKWTIGAISRNLRLHHGVVRRVLLAQGAEGAAKANRPSKIDPFAPFVREQLEKFPDLTASRLFRMCTERGYVGGEDHFRHFVRGLRPRRVPEAFLRRATLPGDEAQVDWGHFGRIKIGRAERPLVAFVMVLSYSRRVYLSFHLTQETGAFLGAHQAAFAAFGGVPRTILYDNLKSAVIDRHAEFIRMNDRMVAFATHHRFEPKACGVRRGNEKGRVERSIRYIRDSFFAGLEFDGLADLNAKAKLWSDEIAGRRAHHEDPSLFVNDAFAKEQSLLLALPEDSFPTHTLLGVRVGKTPYVRVDGNDYSVPHTAVQQEVTALLTENEIVLTSQGNEIARHTRSWGRGERIENKEHIDVLRDIKRRARGASATESLQATVPAAHEFLVEMHKQGCNIGGVVNSLTGCLEQFGGDSLEKALRLVLISSRVTLHHVRQQLDRLSMESGRHAHIVRMPLPPGVEAGAHAPASLAEWDRLSRGGENI